MTADFFGISVLVVSRHMLCQCEDLHVLAYCCKNYIFQGVLCVSWAELPGVTVMRELHGRVRVRFVSGGVCRDLKLDLRVNGFYRKTTLSGCENEQMYKLVWARILFAIELV